MIAGVETDMERSEYMERLDAVAVVNGGTTARGESASTAGGGGKRKRRAAVEGEVEREEGSRRSGKKAKGGQSSSSSLNLPFENITSGGYLVQTLHFLVLSYDYRYLESEPMFAS
ncbi:uncharacterized protein LACBIDRAFT_336201 [Laccaria bicolor S238N-H82]|uniref:Predicted protein n=1 Tax=Laccaria bicolor (strain S238N-H82 / ATCC MYA-4686) TaxID=486041 RepID=B0E4Q1_LACBS|nr:uncharacterized protein LACBIDRAFT_336201 [Laccaria bicolor S238N-H82]EDQ98181.1 predicted protein [Laccaria bicolor S238N-H82]|eukprot:XP_001891169.1 predicted protein [Laccaria bicolor S238N-H82]